MQTSQIRDDWAGTFAICSPWARLLPFWVCDLPMPPCPQSVSDNSLHFGRGGWPTEEGGGGAERKRGSPAGCRAGGGGSLFSQEVSLAAAERSLGSPLPLPGRTGLRQHLLKLWSLAVPPPGAIWKALLRKPWTLPEELRGAGLGQSFGAFFFSPSSQAEPEHGGT